MTRSSKRSPVFSTAPRPSRRAARAGHDAAGNRGNAAAVRLALDGASRVRVHTGAGLYDHFLEQLAFHAGFDLVLEGAGDFETATTIRRKTQRSRSARRSTRLLVIVAESRATATPSYRWTTRSRAQPSTSAAAHTPS